MTTINTRQHWYDGALEFVQLVSEMAILAVTALTITLFAQNWDAVSGLVWGR